MIDHDVYKVEPKNIDLPSYLTLAQSNQEAMSIVSGSYNSNFIAAKIVNGKTDQLHLIDLYYSDSNNITCQKLECGKDYTNARNINSNQCSIMAGDKMYVLSKGTATKITEFN